MEREWIEIKANGDISGLDEFLQERLGAEVFSSCEIEREYLPGQSASEPTTIGIVIGTFLGHVVPEVIKLTREWIQERAKTERARIAYEAKKLKVELCVDAEKNPKVSPAISEFESGETKASISRGKVKPR